MQRIDNYDIILNLRKSSLPSIPFLHHLSSFRRRVWPLNESLFYSIICTALYGIECTVYLLLYCSFVCSYRIRRRQVIIITSGRKYDRWLRVHFFIVLDRRTTRCEKYRRRNHLTTTTVCKCTDVV